MGRANRGGACPIDVHQYIGSLYRRMPTLARTTLETMTPGGYIYLLPEGRSPMSKARNPFAGGRDDRQSSYIRPYVQACIGIPIQVDL